MYKIAILGCENSHANNFLNYIYKDKKCTDVEVVGVYSDEGDAAEKLSAEFGVYAAKSYDEFVGKIDGLVINARHGAKHYKFAKPYIASGIPMFIDKPITTDEGEAVEFMKELKKHGVRVSGGSLLPLADHIMKLSAELKEEKHGKIYGGFLRAPVNMNNQWGNFHFYSPHLIQSVEALFGKYPISVLANVSGDANTVLIKYPEYNVVAQFLDGNYVYHASVSSENGVIGADFTLTGAFDREFAEFYDILTGKPQLHSYRDFISPVFMSCAIERSILSGKEEKLNICEEI